MDAAIVAPSDAEMISCYVLELSGKQCADGYAKDAQMFYTSVCGGCHGNDGRGLGGHYPDLTKQKLAGVQRREQYLRDAIHRAKKR
jgi:mono/diheme cytochrome c family protein